MSVRSQLIHSVLRTWDFSEEGRKYLEWLLQPEADKLDGGAVLREAVLDVMEDDEQLIKLRRKKQKSVLQEVLAALPRGKRAGIQKATNGIDALLRQQTEALRLEVHALREIRHTLDWDRLEMLKLVSDLIDSQPADELTSFLKGHEIARDVASAVTALRRTRVEKVDIDARWKVHSSENAWTDIVQNIADNPGESWFDDYREKLDRYYAHEAVKKLDGMIDRVAALTPVKLEVKDPIVTRLSKKPTMHFFTALMPLLSHSAEACSSTLSRTSSPPVGPKDSQN